MKKILVIVMAYFSVISSSLADQTTQAIAAQCQTDPTGWDGARHSCASEPSSITAPNGFVFAEKSLSGGEDSGNGSEHNCLPSFSNYIEVIPGTGITQPRTLTLQATATGPSGHSSGRGWAICKYTVILTNYK